MGMRYVGLGLYVAAAAMVGCGGDPVLAAVVTLMLYYVLVILVSLPR